MHVSLRDCYDLYDSLKIVSYKLKHGEVCFNREHYGDSWNIEHFLVYLLHVKL
jgi:hypothetical protein